MNDLPFSDDLAPLYSVGLVAGLLGVQQAFLRRLDTHDIVSPGRSEGQQRRYSRQDVAHVQEAVSLIDGGLTLEGVRQVLALQTEVQLLKAEIEQLRRDHTT